MFAAHVIPQRCIWFGRGCPSQSSLTLLFSPGGINELVAHLRISGAFALAYFGRNYTAPKKC